LPAFLEPIILPPMSEYTRPAPHLPLTKVNHRPNSMSPDDVRVRLLERDRLAALGNRSEAAKWLGDPPPWRRALAQRKWHRPLNPASKPNASSG
jgi:hypothetical protein